MLKHTQGAWHIYKEDREVLKHTQSAWHIYKEDREVLKHTQSAWHIYKEDREVLKHTQGAWHIYKEDREVLKHTQGAWHIYKEDREVLKHTQGAWISFPVSNWKKTLDKMKAPEASVWHKMAKAKSKGRETKPSWRKCNPSAQAGEREVRWTDEATKPHTDQEVVEDHVLFM